MQKSIQTLRFKGVEISEKEEEGLLVAILLHDIGHGPFSHAMEEAIVNGVSHETISLLFMEHLNDEFNGSLTVAIEIFRKKYPRKFMNQLVSSQLDMDRADYLKRDSFYSGVAEGNINSERIITMLNVRNEELVVEEKGIYSVEKFLVGRRLMYWQAYLHKTSVVAEQLLIRILKRAKQLIENGQDLYASTALHFFLHNHINIENFDVTVLNNFSRLDDSDIIAAMKEWRFHKDFVLSNLCNMILDRHLLKIKFRKKPMNKVKLGIKIEEMMEVYNITDEEANYFIFSGQVKNQAYDKDTQQINILTKSNKVLDVIEASDQLNLKALSKPVIKYYLCYPKHELLRSN
ncbi:phosphohydrolase [Neptunitalea sp. Y10]|uniref:Phosphohydrolase n=2 Tax=Neptunitalea lumnitzerae TaxID=2965509 RepID=A0ABQ5MJE6_9FLAO|nr:phosphohydrolase [Neptunitalea sp. Y10]